MKTYAPPTHRVTCKDGRSFDATSYAKEGDAYVHVVSAGVAYKFAADEIASIKPIGGGAATKKKARGR